jgi:serine/threonine protein phosphatase 1
MGVNKTSKGGHPLTHVGEMFNNASKAAQKFFNDATKPPAANAATLPKKLAVDAGRKKVVKPDAQASQPPAVRSAPRGTPDAQRTLPRATAQRERTDAAAAVKPRTQGDEVRAKDGGKTARKPSTVKQEVYGPVAPTLADAKQRVAAYSKFYEKEAQSKAGVQKAMDWTRQAFNEGYGDDMFKNNGKTMAQINDVDARVKSGMLTKAQGDSLSVTILSKFERERARVTMEQGRNAEFGKGAQAAGRVVTVAGSAIGGTIVAGPAGGIGAAMLAGSAYDAATRLDQGSKRFSAQFDVSNSLGGLAARKIKGENVNGGDLARATAGTGMDALNGAFAGGGMLRSQAAQAAVKLAATKAGTQATLTQLAKAAAVSNMKTTLVQTGATTGAQTLITAGDGSLTHDQKVDKVGKHLTQTGKQLIPNVLFSGAGSFAGVKLQVPNKLADVTAQYGMDVVSNGVQKSLENVIDKKGPGLSAEDWGGVFAQGAGGAVQNIAQRGKTTVEPAARSVKSDFTVTGRASADASGQPVVSNAPKVVGEEAGPGDVGMAKPIRSNVNRNEDVYWNNATLKSVNEAVVAGPGTPFHGNPGIGKTRRENPSRWVNCYNAFIAGERTFSGQPSVAMPHRDGDHAKTVGNIYDQFGSAVDYRNIAIDLPDRRIHFHPAADIGAVQKAFEALGPGARGGVYGDRGSDANGKKIEGHMFNARVRENGDVEFWDNQHQKPVQFEGQGYKEFHWTRTDEMRDTPNPLALGRDGATLTNLIHKHGLDTAPTAESARVALANEGVLGPSEGVRVMAQWINRDQPQWMKDAQGGASPLGQEVNQILRAGDKPDLPRSLKDLAQTDAVKWARFNKGLLSKEPSTMVKEASQRLQGQQTDAPRIVEFGPGGGDAVRRLLTDNPKATATLVDIDGANLDRLTQAMPSDMATRTHKVMGDASQAALGRDNDLIVAERLMPHLSDAEASRVMQNASASLKPGGELIVDFYTQDHFQAKSRNANYRDGSVIDKIIGDDFSVVQRVEQAGMVSLRLVKTSAGDSMNGAKADDVAVATTAKPTSPTLIVQPDAKIDVKAQSTDGKTLIVLPDTHGRDDLQQKAFDYLRQKQDWVFGDKTIVVGLGDTIDKGPNSAQNVEALINRPQEPGIKDMISHVGNHELWLNQFLQHPDKIKYAHDWIQNRGGAIALQSYERFARDNPGLSTFNLDGIDLKNMPAHESKGLKGQTIVTPDNSSGFYSRLYDRMIQGLPQSHLAFFSQLRPSTQIGDYFFSHAGADPKIDLNKQGIGALTWIRNPYLAHEGAWKGGNANTVAVSGHTVLTKPLIQSNKFAIDLGTFMTNDFMVAVLKNDVVRFAIFRDKHEPVWTDLRQGFDNNLFSPKFDPDNVVKNKRPAG